MLKETISSQIKEALKAHDEVRLSTLRMLLSALNYAKIDKMAELTEEEELSVVKKEAKKRSDAIDIYTKAGKNDLVSSEKAELLILQEFLPAQLSESELNSMIEEVISSGDTNFGTIMKKVLEKSSGAADGKIVAPLVKAKLSIN